MHRSGIDLKIEAGRQTNFKCDLHSFYPIMYLHCIVDILIMNKHEPA